MKCYAASDDGYISKSIRDGSLAIFEESEDAERVCKRMGYNLIELSVVKFETYSRITEENAKLREFVKMVSEGDGADSSVKSVMVHSYIHNAKQLLTELKEQCDAETRR